MYSDDFKQVKEVCYGDIAVLSGLKETITGDTLVSSIKFANSHPELTLSGIKIPDPVFFCCIEPPSMSKQKALELALKNLAREDPSLRLHMGDENSEGQTILSGMGELHLEVILRRIQNEYRIEAELGPLMVAFKEAPSKDVRRTQISFEREIAGSTYSILIELSLVVLKSGSVCSLSLSNHKEDLDNIQSLKPWQIKALRKGFENSLLNGPVLKYPVLQGCLKLHHVEASGKIPDVIYSAAMSNAVKKILAEANTTLLEPVMKLVINCECEVESTVTNDFLLRGGEILDRSEAGGYVAITGNAALRQLRGYSSHIRKISSGKAFFGMEFSHYHRMDEASQNEAIKEVTGFSPI